MWKVKKNIDMDKLQSFGYERFDFDYVTNKPIAPPKYICWIKQINKKKNIQFIGIFIENGILQCRRTYSYYYVIMRRISRKYISNLIDNGIIEKVGE